MSEPREDPVQGMSRLSGHVSSQGGALLAGARVTCGDSETLTLADGFYVFEKLREGTYEVEVSLKSFQSEIKAIALGDDETAVLDFQLIMASGTASIRGRVYDVATEKPIATRGNIILILPISNRFAPVGPDGRYTFDDLPAGTYRLSASIPDYEDCDVTLTLSLIHI